MYKSETESLARRFGRRLALVFAAVFFMLILTLSPAPVSAAGQGGDSLQDPVAAEFPSQYFPQNLPEAGLAARVEQVMGAEHEVGDQVGAAPHTAPDRLHQVLPVGGAERAGQLLPAEERRVSDDGVEAEQEAPDRRERRDPDRRGRPAARSSGPSAATRRPPRCGSRPTGGRTGPSTSCARSHSRSRSAATFGGRSGTSSSPSATTPTSTWNTITRGKT